MDLDCRLILSKDYLQALADAVKTASADLVEVRRGGTSEEQGTWCNFFSVSIREKGGDLQYLTCKDLTGVVFWLYFCGAKQ